MKDLFLTILAIICSVIPIMILLDVFNFMNTHPRIAGFTIVLSVFIVFAISAYFINQQSRRQKTK